MRRRRIAGVVAAVSAVLLMVPGRSRDCGGWRPAPGPGGSSPSTTPGSLRPLPAPGTVIHRPPGIRSRGARSSRGQHRTRKVGVAPGWGDGEAAGFGQFGSIAEYGSRLAWRLTRAVRRGPAQCVAPERFADRRERKRGVRRRAWSQSDRSCGTDEGRPGVPSRAGASWSRLSARVAHKPDGRHGRRASGWRTAGRVARADESTSSVDRSGAPSTMAESGFGDPAPIVSW